MAHQWDPDRYLVYADERGRPFVDLLARVDAQDPARVVDLGCGPGNLTTLLAQRWPSADVLGVDSSAEMVARAADVAGIRVVQGDVRTWRPDAPVDVLFSNATYQWVPGHLELLPALVEHVAPGGWFAFQVPGNHDEPSHVLLHELATDPRFAAYTDGVARPHSHDPAVYADALRDLGLTVDAWETTYLHLLTGEDPVFTWISGTGARPTLQALPDDLRPVFVAEYKALLREAYPPGPHGTTLPFRRIFVSASRHQVGALTGVAHRSDGSMSELTLREARAGDLEAVVRLQREDVIREVREDDVPVAAYRAAFDEISADGHQQLLVGEIDGRVVATAQVTWIRRLTYVGGEMGVVESVRVRSDLRGRGLGERLMRHVVDLARARGAVRVELTTNAQRDAARRFYERLGFVASHVGMKLYLGESSGGEA